MARTLTDVLRSNVSGLFTEQSERVEDVSTGFSKNKIGNLVSGIAGLFDTFATFGARTSQASDFEFKARLTGIRGELEQENVRAQIKAREEEARRVGGEQAVARAKSGVTAEGSPDLVMTEAEAAAANEVAAIRFAGDLRAIETQLTQGQERLAAETTRKVAKIEAVGGGLRAISGFLGAG